jgi:hypothetical protein
MSGTEVLALMTQMATTISGDLPGYAPLTAGMMTTFGAVRDTLSDKLDAKEVTRAADLAATVDKDLALAAAVEQIRLIRDLLKANAVSEPKYAALNIPVASSNLPTTASVPVGVVDTRNRLQHIISFTDSSDPSNKRRPRGVVGCEIWVKIDGPPPGNESECTFLALDTATPYVAQFGPEHAGKTAHYLLRWQFKDGSYSPWSETISATITA